MSKFGNMPAAREYFSELERQGNGHIVMLSGPLGAVATAYDRVTTAVGGFVPQQLLLLDDKAGGAKELKGAGVVATARQTGQEASSVLLMFAVGQRELCRHAGENVGAMVALRALLTNGGKAETPIEGGTMHNPRAAAEARVGNTRHWVHAKLG